MSSNITVSLGDCSFSKLYLSCVLPPTLDLEIEEFGNIRLALFLRTKHCMYESEGSISALEEIRGGS